MPCAVPHGLAWPRRPASDVSGVFLHYSVGHGADRNSVLLIARWLRAVRRHEPRTFQCGYRKGDEWLFALTPQVAVAQPDTGAPRKPVTTAARSLRRTRWTHVKILTPTARTRPSTPPAHRITGPNLLLSPRHATRYTNNKEPPSAALANPHLAKGCSGSREHRDAARLRAVPPGFRRAGTRCRARRRGVPDGSPVAEFMPTSTATIRASSPSPAALAHRRRVRREPSRVRGRLGRPGVQLGVRGRDRPAAGDQLLQDGDSSMIGTR